MSTGIVQRTMSKGLDKGTTLWAVCVEHIKFIEQRSI